MGYLFRKRFRWTKAFSLSEFFSRASSWPFRNLFNQWSSWWSVFENLVKGAVSGFTWTLPRHWIKKVECLSCLVIAQNKVFTLTQKLGFVNCFDKVNWTLQRNWTGLFCWTLFSALENDAFDFQPDFSSLQSILSNTGIDDHQMRVQNTSRVTLAGGRLTPYRRYRQAFREVCTWYECKESSEFGINTNRSYRQKCWESSIPK